MIRKLRYHKGSYQITLPKEIVDFLGWQKNDDIQIELDDNTIRLRNLSKEHGFTLASDLLHEKSVKKNGKKIYTIGYEGLTVEEMIKLLQEHDILILADVRELPLSRKNGFSKTALKKNLSNAGIQYVSFRELGTPKELRHNFKDKIIDWTKFRELYMKYLNNQLDAIKKLEEIAWSKPTAIMCYEKDWRTCHRSIIAEYLEKDGFEVIHL